MLSLNVIFFFQLSFKILLLFLILFLKTSQSTFQINYLMMNFSFIFLNLLFLSNLFFYTFFLLTNYILKLKYFITFCIYLFFHLKYSFFLFLNLSFFLLNIIFCLFSQSSFFFQKLNKRVKFLCKRFNPSLVFFLVFLLFQ